MRKHWLTKLNFFSKHWIITFVKHLQLISIKVRTL